MVKFKGLCFRGDYFALHHTLFIGQLHNDGIGYVATQNHPKVTVIGKTSS